MKRGKVLRGKSILPWSEEDTLSIWLAWYIPGWKEKNWGTSDGLGVHQDSHTEGQ